MSESRAILKEEFKDKEYREVYAHDLLNTYIATQLKVVREQRKMKQADLATLVGTKQAGISRLENVNYSAWSVSTLEKIAFALGARLRVSIETFGSLLDEDEVFSREFLQRPSFEEDPAFGEAPTPEATVVNDLIFAGEERAGHALLAGSTEPTNAPVALSQHVSVVVGWNLESTNRGKLFRSAVTPAASIFCEETGQPSRTAISPAETSKQGSMTHGRTG